MGCTASKLENEDTVRRCKERRRLIKEAVFARHHLAAAHVDYCRSLRITGSSLSDFAADEPLSVSDSTPAVLLPKHPSFKPQHRPPPPPIRTRSFPAVPPSPTPSSVKPPPPPPPYSPTIASSKLPHILSSSSINTSTHRRSQYPRLPHILSDSCPSTPATVKSAGKFSYPASYTAHANYISSPSQASSVWNWENFYPPSPPGSDFFNRRNQEAEDSDENGTEMEREEVHCSEWGDDHYSTTSSASEVGDERETRSKASEFRSQSNFMPNGASIGQENNYKKEDDEDGAPSSVNWGKCRGGINGGVSATKMAVRHRDLKQIVAFVKDCFDKAAASGDQVAEMLETDRAQLDRNFSQLKKTVYHSNGVLSSLSSSWTSKPPLAVKYQFDVSNLDKAGDQKSLCSTLERLLAWEKKLYQEVKAREGVKIDHENKLKALQNQECKGDKETKLDKTKTSIKKLQSLIVVTSQAVDTTSSAIVGLRDTDLVPLLVELCHGFMHMWRSMNQTHEFQYQIVQQVRGLVNQTIKGYSTSELHRQATRDLESALSTWHSSFCRLVKFQKYFICSLHGWFKLTLIPVTFNATQLTIQPSESFSFFDEWKIALDHLPDTVASENIKSFIHVVHVIFTQQGDEMKMKRKTESIAKELEKKASSIRSIEKKYYNAYSTVGIGEALDARDPLAEKKAELVGYQRQLEDERLKYAKAVEVTRAMTLNNLQTGLPGVFQAMTNFSSLLVQALETNILRVALFGPDMQEVSFLNNVWWVCLSRGRSSYS
ncbi:hypothetical protein V2J09_009096 [Rumex salicifolius]